MDHIHQEQSWIGVNGTAGTRSVKESLQKYLLHAKAIRVSRKTAPVPRCETPLEKEQRKLEYEMLRARVAYAPGRR